MRIKFIPSSHTNFFCLHESLQVSTGTFAIMRINYIVNAERADHIFCMVALVRSRLPQVVSAESADHICCMVALVRCGTSRVIRPRPTHLVRGATGHSWGDTVEKNPFLVQLGGVVNHHWWTTYCNGKKPHIPGQGQGGQLDSHMKGHSGEKSLFSSNQSIWGGGCGTSRSNGKKPHTSGQGRQKTFTVEQNCWTCLLFVGTR